MLEQGYGIIPNTVLFSNKINDKQKLLYCLISSLCAEKGYCRASNDYLGEKLNASGETIRKNVGMLVNKGFIRVVLVNGNERRITLVENDQGGGQIGPGGVVENDHPYIYTNITIEYLFQKFYGASKGINEKKCNKLIDNKLKQGVTLDDIHIGMVLYNTECRTSIEWKYVKKFESWITEFQPLTDEQVEETLARLVGEYKKKKQSDEKYSKSKPCKDVWTELCETFGKEKINTLFKQADANKVLLHLT